MFEFERRRNKHERYDRNVVQNTLNSIKKIEEVHVRKEAKLWENRFVSFSSTFLVKESRDNNCKLANWLSSNCCYL